jgi:hypothetical protein
MRVQCDEGNPCGSCERVMNSAIIWKLPCYREKLDRIIAFRAGNARAGKSRSEPLKPRWDASDCDLREVNLFYPFKKGPVTGETGVRIGCRLFRPKDSDVLVEPWTSATGEIVKLQSTPFAIVGIFLRSWTKAKASQYDCEPAIESLEEYLRRSRLAILDEAMDGLTDDLVRLSMKEAARYASKLPVTKTLQLPIWNHTETRTGLCGLAGNGYQSSKLFFSNQDGDIRPQPFGAKLP